MEKMKRRHFIMQSGIIRQDADPDFAVDISGSFQAVVHLAVVSVSTESRWSRFGPDSQQFYLANWLYTHFGQSLSLAETKGSRSNEPSLRLKWNDATMGFYAFAAWRTHVCLSESEALEAQDPAPEPFWLAFIHYFLSPNKSPRSPWSQWSSWSVFSTSVLLGGDWFYMWRWGNYNLCFSVMLVLSISAMSVIFTQIIKIITKP